MESSNYRSSSNVRDDEEDDTNNSKAATTSVIGSTSLRFTATDSFCSRSLHVQKLKMPSPLSGGDTKQVEEQNCDLGKRAGSWWKRVEKRRRSRHVKKLEKKHEWSSVSRFSGSKTYGKGCNWLGNKRRNSRREFNYQDNIKCRTENQVVEAQGNGKRKVGLDARDYREWLSPYSRKDMLGKRDRMSQKGGNVARANSWVDVEEVVVENCLSCSKKRRRLDFDSKQQCCYCSAKPSHDLHGISLLKVCCEEACMAQGCPPKDGTAVIDIKDETQDGRESISRLSMELTEEDTGDARGEESHLETKTDGEHNACIVCMLGGKLLCCEGKGCQRRYHLSCLDPPFNNAPPGVWHCAWCVKKKIELGVHSVSKEMESVWDVREVVSEQKEMQRQKEYLVKHHGLSHAYNQWIPETKLLLEVPRLVAKFNRKNQVIKWKKEWTVPQRLLQKRLLSFGKHLDEYCQQHDESNSDCQYEWLVKWTGLGYEHATWELEDASFLTSLEAIKLIRDYESRHEKTERMSSLSQADEEGKAYFPRLSELSFGGSPGAYDHYQSYVNKLHERWRKGQNAIVIDDQADQERVVKVILFMLSLQHTIRRPFLIISTSNSLSVWEAEFLHVAPSANFIVYKGNKDVRSSIRSLEFRNEGGRIMFEVLLSSSNIVIEDMEVLKCIDWKAIIIDECQRSNISKHFKQFKMLTASTRLLLVSTQIKDCSVDFLNMLSLLDSGLDGLNSRNMEICSITNVNKLKERLAPYTAYEGKSGSFRFVEYWVPVRLSNVQLEQYCAVLLSNSMLLCSCLKNDPALREVIISIRKCCNHPYLLDQSVQSKVRKGLPIEEYLDAEIQVSGKLLLLDKILSEIKSQDLRALIIFQSISGSGRDSIGDILDDFVRQRFGKDCYVRIDGVYARSKKQAALKMFNDKESGKFVLLIENRACLPSIRLSSVDTVILFDSDWDPRNDLRALHRITITSQFEQLKVFRLYSCFTVEEMMLILAKKGETLDNTIDSMNRKTCHTLLNWGASHLFNKLDDFHGHKTFVCGSNIFSEQSVLDDVICELTTQFPFRSENVPGNYSSISKAQQNGGAYSRNISLIGEKEMHLMDTEPTFFSWKKLLEGRHPRWHFLSESSPRIRRKVQYFDNLPRESEFENDAVKKKSCKMVSNQVDPIHLKSRTKHKGKLIVADVGCKVTDQKEDSNQANCSPAMHLVDNDITRGHGAKMVEYKKRNRSPSRLKKTESSLKLEITQLCDILKLPKNVKDIAVTFFEHIMKDYDVSWETDSTLQAFQISLCWTAASFLKHKIDHRKSLVLAKQHLKFDCMEEEANYIFSTLQNTKKSFACHLENVKIVKESNYENNSKLTALDQEALGDEEALMRLNHAKNFESTTSDQRDVEEGEIPMGSQSKNLSDQLIDLEEGEIPMNPNHAKNSKSTSGQQNLDGGELPMGSQSQSYSDQPIDLEEGEIPLGSKNSKSTAFDQQDLEKREMLIGSPRQNISDKLVDLEEGEIDISTENQNSAIIGQKPGSGMLENNLKEKIDDSNCQMELRGNNLNTSQLMSRIVGEQVTEKPVTSLGSPCLSDSEFNVDKMQPTEISRVHVGSKNSIPEAIPSLSKQNHCETVPIMPSEVSDISLNEKEFCSLPAGTVTIIVESDTESDCMEPFVAKEVTATCSKHNEEVNSPPHGLKNGAPVLVSPEKQSLARNEQIIDSAMKPFETRQTQQHEVVIVDDPVESVAHAMPTEKESTALERSILSEVRQDITVATPICVESPTLEFAGTSSSLVQQNHSTVRGNSFPLQQLPVSAVPSSAVHGLPGIPTVIGTQCYQNGRRFASGQEAQVSRQPLLEDPVELLDPSVTDLPLQPLTSMYVGGNETNVEDLRSRSNVQDFRSTDTFLGSLDDHLLHNNHVTPEITQPSCSDPLQIEMERIKKDDVQDLKIHAEMILRIKSECDKEIGEVLNKYDTLLQDAEAALLKKRTDRRTIFQKVFVSKLLAEALTGKNSSYKDASSPGTREATASSHMNPLIQPPVPQTAQMPALRPGQCVASSPVASSMELINHSLAVLPPYSSPMTCFPRNLPRGSELRAPAPHIEAYRSHSSVLMPNFPLLHNGVPYQQFPSSSTVTSMMQTQPADRQFTGSSNIHLPES